MHSKILHAPSKDLAGEIEIKHKKPTPSGLVNTILNLQKIKIIELLAYYNLLL